MPQKTPFQSSAMVTSDVSWPGEPMKRVCRPITIGPNVRNGQFATGRHVAPVTSDARSFRAEIRFRRYLGSLPWDNNSRNHNKAYSGFLMAAHLGISKQTALDTVEQRISASGGTIDYGDLMQQVHRAYEYLDNKTDGEAVLQAEKPSSFSPDLLKMISGSKRIDDPVNFIGQRSMRSPKLVTSEDFLNCLYEPGENVVVFTTQQSQGQVVFKVGELDCQPLPKQGLEGVWYLIQPVDGLWHETQTPGRLSRRSKEAVVHWRYLLLESDEAEIDQWLRLVIQLPLRISAIYTSGGRSIHVLVRVDASSKEEWDGFKVRIARILVPLGADPRALTAVRLSRLPQCMRGERLQELLYLNPAAVATPILELPPHAPENFKEDHHERSD